MPPFSFHSVPAPYEIADKLACAIPEHERREASAILVEHILSVKLAGIDHHPSPRRLSAVVYKELARVISAKPPNMRLHTLRLYAFDAYIHYMLREATNLAIARFAMAHPDLDASGFEHWFGPQVEELRLMQPSDIADIATRSLEGVHAWRASITENYPAEWSRHRVSHHVVVSTLGAASTGQFERVAGQLYQFLCELGQQPEELPAG